MITKIDTNTATIKRNQPATNTLHGRTKRAEILAYVRAYLTANDSAPNYREIGEAVGLSSSSTVKSHLDILEAEGMIIRYAGQPRSIRVVGMPLSESERVRAILLRIQSIATNAPNHLLRDQLQREIDEALYG